MAEKKLSEELRRCLEDDACGDCQYHKPETKFICKGLLQKAYEAVKRYEEMFPCKVGDIVWRVHKETKLSPNRVYECRVTGIKQEFNTFSVKLHANINEETYSIWVDDWFDKCQMGYEFFLTKEAAEKALKEMKSKNKPHCCKLCGAYIEECNPKVCDKCASEYKL
jgi:hypothetical protein